MTAFEWDNLPEELTVEPLPEETFEDAFEALQQALTTRQCLARAIKAAYVYDRRGYMEADALGGRRNAGYSSGSDDVVLQVTVRIQNPKGRRGTLCRLAELEEGLTERRIKAERKRLEDGIRDDEAAAVKAKQSAEQKREQLRVLNGGMK